MASLGYIVRPCPKKERKRERVGQRKGGGEEKRGGGRKGGEKE
jgi:hypothetical protein